MKDFTQLRVFLTTLRLIGQIPIQVRSQGQIRLSWLSSSGLWCILLTVLNSVAAAVAVVIRINQVITVVGTDGNLDHRTVIILRAMTCLFTYTFPVVWLFSVSKFMELWRSLWDFDINFGRFTKWVWDWNVVSLTAACCFSWIMDSRRADDWMDMRVELGSKLSWIPDILLHPRVFETTTLVHCITVSLGNLLVHIVMAWCARMITRRLDELSQLVSVDHTGANAQSWVWPSAKAWSFKVMPGEMDRRDFFAHLNAVVKVFRRFDAAVEPLLCAYILYGTVVLSMFTFLMVSNLAPPFRPLSSYKVWMIATCVAIGVRMFVLANWAQTLQDSMKVFKRKIMETPIPPSSVDALDLINLKIYVSGLTFEISPGGYFVMARSTLTKILGAVITYTVILVQFDMADTDDS